MYRFRSLAIAIAALALTAGVASARTLPTADLSGLTQASLQADEASAHGMTLAAAATGEVPAGEWSNRGEYLSSLATEWGPAIAAEHQTQAALPAQAEAGVAHRP